MKNREKVKMFFINLYYLFNPYSNTNIWIKEKKLSWWKVLWHQDLRYNKK